MKVKKVEMNQNIFCACLLRIIVFYSDGTDLSLIPVSKNVTSHGLVFISKEWSNIFSSTAGVPFSVQKIRERRDTQI